MTFLHVGGNSLGEVEIYFVVNLYEENHSMKKYLPLYNHLKGCKDESLKLHFKKI